MTIALPLLLASVMAVAPRAEVSSRLLSDGTELVVGTERGASWGSLRYVFRVGGGADPDEQAGLAHLLEHLVFHGSYGQPGEAFFRSVQSAGARVNAHTSADATVYELDAPSQAFPALAEAFLRIITNPALGLADLHHERGVVATEAYYRNTNSLWRMLDQRLFSKQASGEDLGGTPLSRERISAASLMSFYAGHYVPPNSTLIVVGDMTGAAAEALYERSSALPPLVQPDVEAVLKTGHHVPLVPLDDKVRADIVASFVGYHLPQGDPRLCAAVAQVLRWRLHDELVLKGGMEMHTNARCVRMRGELFLIGVAASFVFESGMVQDGMARAFAGLARQRMTAAETALVERRERVTRPRGEQLAQVLAELASTPRPLRTQTDLSANQPVKLNVASIKAAAEKWFVRERLVQLHVSPFEG